MLKVFYHPKMTVLEPFESLVESATKPGLFVAAAGSLIEVIDFPPLTREELSVSHPRRHVDRVLDGVWNNGYGNSHPSLALSFPYECGSFYHAAVEALRSQVTMSPSVGFHHADYQECWNFCTFNGLTIAAILLKDRGLVNQVGIIDFDCHWGNGTDAIIERLGLDFIHHYTFGKFKRTVRKGIGFDRWLEELPAILEEMFQSSDILFYQAGVDAHLEDRFGGELTTEQIQRRDQTVFRFAHGHNIPLVWNLAGGYQSPYSKVIELHMGTLHSCTIEYQFERKKPYGAH